MVLSEKDGQLFYKLWFSVLDYVNKKYKVNKKLKNISQAKALNPQEVKEVADVLWNDVSIIDEYLLESGSKFSEEEQEIIASWKYCVQGTFLMERHLKKGTIFVGEDDSVYQVSGIISSWEEMFPFAKLPVMLEATFIPFKDVIISDGLVMAYPVVIGGNMKKQLKGIYMTAKKENRLIKTVEDMKNNIDKESRWKKFDKMIGKCYSSLAGVEKDEECWRLAFEIMKENILEERKTNPKYGLQLEELEETIDFSVDIQGWIEDCLDEIEMKRDYETLLDMCEELLELFEWPEYTGADIKFKKMIALVGLKRVDESVDFCEQWLMQETLNFVAATATIYAYISAKRYDAAEKVLNHFLESDSECTDENSMLFVAGSILYKEMGKKKEQKKLDKAIKKYEELLKEYYMGNEFDDEWDEDDNT